MSSTSVEESVPHWKKIIIKPGALKFYFVLVFFQTAWTQEKNISYDFYIHFWNMDGIL